MRLTETQERELVINEGHNQILYLLLCLSDENTEHDNWHPKKRDILIEARFEIMKRLKYQKFPLTYPNFEKYTYCSS
jgi:hypothetical protein